MVNMAVANYHAFNGLDLRTVFAALAKREMTPFGGRWLIEGMQ
jgi:hypothetical protein